MALVLSGSIDISGSMTATTILISSPGAAGMVSSSAQITELAPLMAYTASLKGAAIVSSSQQITNYYKFAETASANHFYGTQTISGSLNVSSSLFVSSSSTFKGNLTIQKTAPNIFMKGGYSQDLGFFLNNEPAAYLVDDATATKGMKVNISTGDVSIITGNLIMGTSGKGIDFSATSNSSGTMTSELLNDYEEGTWTPSFAGTTSESGQVYATQDGTYTKVGRLVTFQGNIALSTLGTITGFVKINGLPFTALGTPTIKPATTIAYNTTITTIPASDMYGANNFIYLYKVSQTNPTSTTQLSQGDLTATTVWSVNGFYYTA
jgi:hypothetical protein